MRQSNKRVVTGFVAYLAIILVIIAKLLTQSKTNEKAMITTSTGVLKAEAAVLISEAMVAFTDVSKKAEVTYNWVSIIPEEFTGEPSETLILFSSKESIATYTADAVIQSDAECVKNVGDYFDLYNDITRDMHDIEKIIDIGKKRAEFGAGKNWVSFENISGRIPNKYAVTEGIGYMRRDEVDKVNQVYRGRYMIAVGPAVMLEDYKGQFVTAEEFKYGTFIDVGIRDKNGQLYYIPCVVADCKAHTYPTGYIQTGVAVKSNGEFDKALAYADGSSVEFTCAIYNSDGSSRSESLKDYELVKFIVYKLEASME